MAFVYAQEGAWYKAIEEYKKLLSLDPQDAHVLGQMGDAYAKQKDDLEAFDAFLKAKEVYERRGDANKVASILKRIAKLSPDKMDLKQRQFLRTLTQTAEAEGMAAEGRAEDAVAHYQQLIAKEPVNFSYREKLVALHMEHAQVHEALLQLSAMAGLHLSEGRPDQAKDYAKRMQDLDPEGIGTVRLLFAIAKAKADAEGLKAYGAKLSQLAFDAGAPEEALASVEAAVAAGAGDHRLLRAKCLLAVKRGAEAKKIFEELLRENPEDDVLLEQLVTLSEETRDWASAYVHLAELMKRRTGDAKLLPRMARALLQTGKRPEALKMYMDLALESLKENKAEAALSYLDSIVALEPDNLEALKKKAEIYIKLNRKQELIDTYKKLQAVFTAKKMPEEAKKAALVLAKLSPPPPPAQPPQK
jgi:tetratricopeptide (TPR) repeat protein